MIIFFYGPDSYRRQRKINKIIEEYRLKHSNLSLDQFDFESPEEFLRVKEFSAQMLIFDNKKLAVVRNIFEADRKALKFFFEKYLNSEDFTILISEASAPPPDFKFLLKKAFRVEKFENLKTEKWQFFIQKEARERNLILTPAALNFLSEAYKDDTWGLVNELEKLSLINKNLPIDLKDLKRVGDYPFQSPDIFGFFNAVLKNWNVSQKIVALEKLFISQEEPVKIFNILASLKRLPQELIQKLADYDIMVKSGKLDYEEILIDLAL